MNVHKLWEYREYMNVNGMMLSNELISLLQNSLTMLQVENHFLHVQYWGQLYAVDADYHIAVGISSDALVDRKYFYTTDFKYWALLPKAKRRYKLLSLLATFPFRGDPTLKVKILDEAIEENNPDRCQVITEEGRMAGTIANICDEAEICARGQLIKQPDGKVVINPNFYGLTASEAQQLKSYLHIRPPQQQWNSNLLSRQDYNYSMDFLDSVDQDIPNGCWNLSLEQSGSVAYLKSLYWPGMTYFHKDVIRPRTRSTGRPIVVGVHKTRASGPTKPTTTTTQPLDDFLKQMYNTKAYSGFWKYLPITLDAPTPWVHGNTTTAKEPPKPKPK